MRFSVKTALCLAAAAGIVFYSKISFTGLSFRNLCALNRLTGLYCPFCGGTRAVRMLTTGDFSEAFGMNQMVVFLLPLSVGIALAPSKKLKKAAPWIILGIMLLYLVIRNIPSGALDFLRPG